MTGRAKAYHDTYLGCPFGTGQSVGLSGNTEACLRAAFARCSPGSFAIGLLSVLTPS